MNKLSISLHLEPVYFFASKNPQKHVLEWISGLFIHYRLLSCILWICVHRHEDYIRSQLSNKTNKSKLGSDDKPQTKILLICCLFLN